MHGQQNVKILYFCMQQYVTLVHIPWYS
jgi:hypothetical protein